MTPEQKIARTKKLVSAARALLSLQVGLAVGAKRVADALHLLDHEVCDKHSVFFDFYRAIPADIPLGNVRLLWQSDAMIRTDSKLAEIENIYREKLLSECAVIIRTYS